MPKFTRPQSSVFERVEDERLHRKQRLAAALRSLGGEMSSEALSYVKELITSSSSV